MVYTETDFVKNFGKQQNMDIDFHKSKGFAIYILPTITFLDYTTTKQIKFSFWYWHMQIVWKPKKIKNL